VGVFSEHSVMNIRVTMNYRNARPCLISNSWASFLRFFAVCRTLYLVFDFCSPALGVRYALFANVGQTVVRPLLFCGINKVEVKSSDHCYQQVSTVASPTGVETTCGVTRKSP